MAVIKTPEEIEILREGGKRLARIMDAVCAAAVPGVTTLELDRLAEKLVREGGDTPALLGYQPRGSRIPYPATICISVNDEIVHGIPSSRVLKDGDIVGLDLVIEHGGMFTDMARTVEIGKVDAKAHDLVETTGKALAAGIAEVRAGARMGDVSAAIEAVANKKGYGVVRELGGHGVGNEIHETPYVPNFGKRGKGEVLKAGMVFAIEPMFTAGSPEIVLAGDEYTYKTRDGKRSAHFEHTVLVTDKGAEILTL